MYTQANKTHVSSPSCVEGPVFKPASREDLVAAIEECLKVSDYDCSRGAKGPIGEWDVSAVTDMSALLCHFNVNKLKCLAGAERFNGDISKWDVSRVTNMQAMFFNAVSFSQTLCGAWRDSKADKRYMFSGSNGNVCPSS